MASSLDMTGLRRYRFCMVLVASPLAGIARLLQLIVQDFYVHYFFSLVFRH